MRDPYEILGVQKDAPAGDIKKAYRKLAKANHPDQNKDPRAKDRFNEATHAYDLLNDETKRSAFDRGEIDADGKPRFAGFGAGGGRSAGGGPGAGFEHFDFNGGNGGRGGFDPSDIFSELFSGSRRRPGSQPRPTRGEDIQAEVVISLKEAALGANVRVNMPTGRTLDVTIPPAIEAGQQIRLKGQGHPALGRTGTEFAGDAIVTVQIARHPQFRVEGRDLYLDLPVTLYEAALGGPIAVPTLTGSVEMNIPPGAGAGKAMRLRGKGLPNIGGSAGDLYLTPKIVLPAQTDSEFATLMRRWRDDAPYHPRKDSA